MRRTRTGMHEVFKLNLTHYCLSGWLFCISGRLWSGLASVRVGCERDTSPHVLGEAGGGHLSEFPPPASHGTP